MKQLGKNTASVTMGELGTNCWKAARFVEGSRCERVLQCSYPERKTCKAVQSERVYLLEHKKEVIRDITKTTDEKLDQLGR